MQQPESAQPPPVQPPPVQPPQPPAWKIPAAPSAAPPEPPPGPPATPPPATPPPSTPPPATPPPGPAPWAGPHPDVPAPSLGLTSALDLRVSKRLLWVGGAVYPLQSIARVYTYTLHPRRKEAVNRFIRRVGLIIAVSSVLTLLGGVILAVGGEDGGGGSLITLLWLASLAALIYSVVDLVQVLSAKSHFVLGVETSGPSTAVVAGRDHAQLRQLVHQISYAIENPETEFRVRVETLVINSPSNYYFGDSVNMYGGSGNVGMANS
ncbi:DUF6232 family protein [Streptomyces sp. NPDC000594]|uniref:DUF6232 family protein n=1 Tax=Streptomyces sp. NPDC000594 TaxID=3154261 RepID=UPI00331DCB40